LNALYLAPITLWSYLNYGRPLKPGTQSEVKVAPSDKPESEKPENDKSDNENPENERVKTRGSGPTDIDSSGTFEHRHEHLEISEHDWMKHGSSPMKMGSGAHPMQLRIQGEAEMHQKGHTVAKQTLPQARDSQSEGDVVHGNSHIGDDTPNHEHKGHGMVANHIMGHDPHSRGIMPNHEHMHNMNHMAVTHPVSHEPHSEDIMLNHEHMHNMDHMEAGHTMAHDPQMIQMMEERPMFATITIAACHCGAGCLLGDIVGEWLVYGTNAQIHSRSLYPCFLIGKDLTLLSICSPG
jgi:hypothetical protein